eukprot:m.295704 g.295704  ORF g.295704 m.295704 type:complete len:162 (-) comp22972_c9_seq1:1340-1825(-)
MFACDLCDQSFLHAAWLKKHVREVHEDIRRFECPNCSLRFKRKADMERHCRTMHENTHKVLCVLCGKGYENPALLPAHHEAHQREGWLRPHSTSNQWFQMWDQAQEDLRQLRAQQGRRENTSCTPTAKWRPVPCAMPPWRSPAATARALSTGPVAATTASS